MMMTSTMEYNPQMPELLTASPSMTWEILEHDTSQHKISSPKFRNNWSYLGLGYFDSTVTNVVTVMETKRVIDPSSVVTLTVNGCGPAPSDVPICEEDIILPSTQEKVIMNTAVPMATDTLLMVEEKLSVTPIIDVEENTPTLNPQNTEESNEIGSVEGETTEENLPTDETNIKDAQSTGSISEDNEIITTTEFSDSEFIEVTLPQEKSETADNVAELQEDVTAVNAQEEEEDGISVAQPTEISRDKEMKTFDTEFSKKYDTEAIQDPKENQLLDLEVTGMPIFTTSNVQEDIETLPADRKDESIADNVIATTIVPEDDDELSDRSDFTSVNQEHGVTSTPAVDSGSSELSQTEASNDGKTSNMFEYESKFKSSETIPKVSTPNEIPDDTVMISVIVQDNTERSTTIINDIIKAQEMPTTVENLAQVEETISSIMSLLPARQDNLA